MMEMDESEGKKRAGIPSCHPFHSLNWPPGYLSSFILPEKFKRPWILIDKGSFRKVEKRYSDLKNKKNLTYH